MYTPWGYTPITLLFSRRRAGGDGPPPPRPGGREEPRKPSNIGEAAVLFGFPLILD
jgi:hypothetical protein